MPWSVTPSGMANEIADSESTSVAAGRSFPSRSDTASPVRNPCPSTVMSMPRKTVIEVGMTTLEIIRPSFTTSLSLSSHPDIPTGANNRNNPVSSGKILFIRYWV